MIKNVGAQGPFEPLKEGRMVHKRPFPAARPLQEVLSGEPLDGTTTANNSYMSYHCQIVGGACICYVHIRLCADQQYQYLTPHQLFPQLIDMMEDGSSG